MIIDKTDTDEFAKFYLRYLYLDAVHLFLRLATSTFCLRKVISVSLNLGILVLLSFKQLLVRLIFPLGLKPE